LKGLSAPGAFGNEAYGAAKHGVVGLMRQFAVEFSKDQIRVNSVHPTGVDTMMVRNEAMESFLGAFPDATSSLTNLLPVELLQPRDINDAVLFLASDLSRYITGVTLPVDAGFTAK
jgi:NAD(P)-dependent dehydrogenase (short-subunit alcohol dehydrogenase family)